MSTFDKLRMILSETEVSNIKTDKMKVALVHDYLKEFGGAERVLLALHEIWPEAPIYTIFSKWGEKNGEVRGVGDLRKARIIESWFGKIPFCDKLISPLRFLIPLVWRSFDFSQYDLIISSASWAVTKGFGPPRLRRAERGEAGGDKGNLEKKPVEVCYCHTPPRYLYGYETSRDWMKNPFIRFYALIVNHFLRMYDFQQAQKVTYFIANSREVQGRIKKFYRRESVVIYPPVEMPLTAYSKQQIVTSGKLSAISNKQYFLTGGRLEKAKNFNLIIKACNQLKVPLKIYGSGSQEKYLRTISGPTAEFVGKINDRERQELMVECQAFIVAATDEDFGITPVEAMACGASVIAYRGGGYLETVVEGKTGVFFDEATLEGVVRGIRDFGAVGDKIKPEDCRKQAEKFSKERFKKEITKFVENIYA